MLAPPPPTTRTRPPRASAPVSLPPPDWAAGLAPGTKPFFFFTGDEGMGKFGRELGQNVRRTIDPSAQGATRHPRPPPSLPRAIAAALSALPPPPPLDLRSDRELRAACPLCRLPGPWDQELVWQHLKEKYHVFCVGKPGLPVAEWERILGKGRVLMLKTPKAVVDCILGASVRSGAGAALGRRLWAAGSGPQALSPGLGGPACSRTACVLRHVRAAGRSRAVCRVCCWTAGAPFPLPGGACR